MMESRIIMLINPIYSISKENIPKSVVIKQTGSNFVVQNNILSENLQRVLSKHCLVNFKGYDGMSRDYNMPMRTSFFRDIKTLELATGVIRRNFPEGASILDYACSDGEEAISILALLDGDDENKYDIVGLDKSASAIEAAQKGRYREAMGYGEEGFLFNPYDGVISEKNKKIKEKFRKIMDETVRNEKRIYGYTVKEKYKDKIKYEPCEKGDIFAISELETQKPVGAVFFRNALYQLFGRGFDYADINKVFAQRETVIDLVDEVYNKLAPGGVFVLGSCSEDKHFNALITNYIRQKMSDSFMSLNHQDIGRESPTVFMKVK